ncbi:unnamed protein product, partial [Mesorhabditis spiculigera]
MRVDIRDLVLGTMTIVFIILTFNHGLQTAIKECYMFGAIPVSVANKVEIRKALPLKSKRDDCIFVTLGINQDIRLEEAVKATQPNCKFFGADPVAEGNKKRALIDYMFVDIDETEYDLLEMLQANMAHSNGFAFCQIGLKLHNTVDIKKQKKFYDFVVRLIRESGYTLVFDDQVAEPGFYHRLIESKGKPNSDPLLIWFNGGPGCSSFGGAFEEMGPFYVDNDGFRLYENKYAWNARANLLFIESPVGVGFSYSTDDFYYAEASDDQTTAQNYMALKDFFASFTDYKNRKFFLSGESYAGVYVPTLTLALARGINNGDFPNSNFQGSNIGNGYMHVEYLYNSQVVWSAYHGMVSMDELRFLKANCTLRATVIGDLETYSFVEYMTTEGHLEYESDGSACGDLIERLVNMPDMEDEYNYYQDCYVDPPLLAALPQRPKRMQRRKNRARKQTLNGIVDKNADSSGNPAAKFNYISTDGEWGYPCWNDVLLTVWANRKDVQEALHIDVAWRATNLTWQDCNDPMYDAYNVTYTDLTTIFEDFLKENRNPNFRFLIHNGDVDTICNYLGEAWFMRRLAERNAMEASPRRQWFFSDQTAGFVQRFTHGSGVIFDLMTGAGHFPAADRPGPARQLITNFIWGPVPTGPDYNSTAGLKLMPTFAPLLNEATSDAPSTTSGLTPTTSKLTTTRVKMIQSGMAAQEIRRQETREVRQTDTMRSKKSESFMDKLSGTLGRKKKPEPTEGGAPHHEGDHRENEHQEMIQYEHEGREALDYALIPAISKKIEIEEGAERRFLTRESSEDSRIHEVIRLLLGWINDEVAGERIVVKNIQDDIYDGQVLQKLIEKLADIRIEVPEFSQSEEGQIQKLEIVVSTANRLLTPGQYENPKWTHQMIHQKDIVAIIQLLVSLAVFFRAPVRFPEHVSAQVIVARKENGQVKTRYTTEQLTDKQDELCPKGERDAFDTLFDYGPDKLAHVKGSLLAFCNKHLNKINLEVNNIETQFQDGVFLVLLMGLLEGYFVPLHHFHLQVSTHEEKMKNVQFAYQLMDQVGIKPKSRVADIANGDVKSTLRLLHLLFTKYKHV